eukprot:GGOE01009487.1.p1 GENE.GGOE01009487.1~~GGOE01009487.1.p1  ORF type:complete len:132 (-),score=5.91 GGOE01009487.1:752-1147(-)
MPKVSSSSQVCNIPLPSASPILGAPHMLSGSPTARLMVVHRNAMADLSLVQRRLASCLLYWQMSSPTTPLVTELHGHPPAMYGKLQCVNLQIDSNYASFIIHPPSFPNLLTSVLLGCYALRSRSVWPDRLP